MARGIDLDVVKKAYLNLIIIFTLFIEIFSR
jgi:hypothetical protein